MKILIVGVIIALIREFIMRSKTKKINGEERKVTKIYSFLQCKLDERKCNEKVYMKLCEDFLVIDFLIKSQINIPYSSIKKISCEKGLICSYLFIMTDEYLFQAPCGKNKGNRLINDINEYMVLNKEFRTNHI